MRHLLAALAALFAFALATAPAAAQTTDPAPRPDLRITTDYPSVTVQAGDSVDLDINVLADEPTPVDLAITEAPEGWDLTLRGGGFVLDGVTAMPESPPPVELEVVIPPATEPGVHRLTVEARAGGDVAELPVAVTVADRPVGGILLSTDFASLRGRPSDTFRYDMQIANQTPEEITFAFDGRGPDGWVVTAGPASEQRASTVTVAPGDTESVRVEADPPSSTPAGTYDIEVSANGGGQSGSFTLTAEVTGQSSIELVSDGARLDLRGSAGEEIEARVFVVNDGSAPLEDVRVSADEPEGWSVEFEPTEIAAVEAGGSESVTVRIKPSGDAVAGDYAVGVEARASGESSDLAYRFSVETSRWWGAVGVAVIVAAFAVLLAVFRRFGRR